MPHPLASLGSQPLDPKPLPLKNKNSLYVKVYTIAAKVYTFAAEEIGIFHRIYLSIFRLQAVQFSVNKQLDVANGENEKIYHERVPSADSLGQPDRFGKTLAKPTPVGDLVRP